MQTAESIAESLGLKVGDDVIDRDGRRAQIAHLTMMKIRGVPHALAMVDYFDTPAAGANSSEPVLAHELMPAPPLPAADGEPVVVVANVEAMSSRSNRYELDRATWDSWPPGRQAREVAAIGDEEVSSAGGYGASVLGADD